MNPFGNSVVGMSSDNIIYISTLASTIFTTYDHGYSWTTLKQVPKPNDIFSRVQAMKIQSSDTLWSTETLIVPPRMRVVIYYSNETFREIENVKRNVPQGGVNTRTFRLVGAVQLGAVLLIDELNKAVRVFNMAGEPEGQLMLPGIDSNVGPCSATMDNQTLYLGMRDGRVHIFTLARK
jgi:hypothetical protein